MSETGVVKFSYELIERDIEWFEGFDDLDSARTILLRKHLLGVDASGVAYGNLSVRAGGDRQFYVTCSGASAKGEFTPADCAQVVSVDLDRNWLRCEGRCVASSESLTHAAIYESRPKIRAVVHFHDENRWRNSCGRLPTTAAEAEYGTPAIAVALVEVVCGMRENCGLVVLGGHPGGLIAFGQTMTEALNAVAANN